jgi:4-phosphopantoate--beta-alanine ligase
MRLPKSHPRYESLRQRHAIIDGIAAGVTAQAGLIAQGRGETFDYLIGERTTPNARAAIRAAATRMLSTPTVLSANGNIAALCPAEYSRLSKALGAPIEVNLFYRSEKRVAAIEKAFRKHGVAALSSKTRRLKVESQRSKTTGATMLAETVLVPLEDGDRTEALKRRGKFVIAIDLNPMSRTARAADITIVDNIVRAVPLLVREVENLKKENTGRARRFNNKANLRAAMRIMRSNLDRA